jgi:hypothetical protein
MFQSGSLFQMEESFWSSAGWNVDELAVSFVDV